jgi:predicted amidophosphoribosyltransferase
VRGVGRLPGAFAYAGVGAEVVQALKFRDGRRLVGAVADLMAGPAADEVDRRGATALTWLPTTAARRRDRGFDQAELLARALGRRLDLPVRPYLRRRPGRGQTGRTRAERDANVRFAARRGLPPSGVVLAVDDVCTTGATARAGVAELARSGVVAGVVVAARTP